MGRCESYLYSFKALLCHTSTCSQGVNSQTVKSDTDDSERRDYVILEALDESYIHRHHEPLICRQVDHGRNTCQLHNASYIDNLLLTLHGCMDNMMYICLLLLWQSSLKEPFIRNYGKTLGINTLILINISTQLHTKNYISIVCSVII